MPDFIPLEQAPAWIGRELFISPWMTTSVRHLELFHAATELDPAVTDMAVCETNPAPDLVDGFWLQSMLANGYRLSAGQGRLMYYLLFWKRVSDCKNIDLEGYSGYVISLVR